MKSNKFVKILIAVLVGIVALGIYYYITIPAINIHSTGTWGAILFVVAVLAVLALLRGYKKNGTQGIEGLRSMTFSLKETSLLFKVLAIVFVGLCLVYLFGSLLSSPFFNAAKYQKLLTIEQREFTEDIKEVDYKTIPLLDKASASLLGNRKMGSMVDMVSQFEVTPD